MPAPSGCQQARSNNLTVHCPVLREVACNATHASKSRTSGHEGGGAKAMAEEAVWGCRRQIARILHSALPRPCSGPARRNTPLHRPYPQASLAPIMPQRGAGVRARGHVAERDCVASDPTLPTIKRAYTHDRRGHAPTTLCGAALRPPTACPGLFQRFAAPADAERGPSAAPRPQTRRALGRRRRRGTWARGPRRARHRRRRPGDMPARSVRWRNDQFLLEPPSLSPTASWRPLQGGIRPFVESPSGFGAFRLFFIILVRSVSRWCVAA